MTSKLLQMKFNLHANRKKNSFSKEALIRYQRDLHRMTISGKTPSVDLQSGEKNIPGFKAYEITYAKDTTP